MTRRGTTYAGSCLLAWLAIGCAIVAPQADYADYREVRLARSEPQELLAMRDYLAAHPRGMWAEDIRAKLRAREDVVYGENRDDIEGLKLYLRVYPEGRFAAQAKARLRALEETAERKRNERKRAEAREAQRRKEAAERQRTWVGRFTGYWLERLLQLDGWGEPLSQVAPRNPVFAEAYGKAPAPRCTPRSCVKFYTADYAIPVPSGTRIERTLHLVLRLGLNEGRLERAELLLPGHGFSRWYELEQRQEVVQGDPERRKQALAWAQARIEALVKQASSAAQPLSNAALPALSSLDTKPTGARIDPTLRSPGDADAGGSGEGEPRDGAQDETDLVMEPTQVGEGAARPSAAEPEAQAGTDGEEVGAADATVVMEPARVGGGGEAEDASQPAEPLEEGASFRGPRVVKAWALGDLRIVVFADMGAAADLDGLLIEPRAHEP